MKKRININNNKNKRLTGNHIYMNKLSMGWIFDSYSKFWIFEYSTFIQFNSKFKTICSYVNEYRSNIFLHVLHRKIGPWRSFTFWLNFEKTTTAKLLLTYLICIRICMHTPGYKIKSLTLLKRTNFTKQNKLAKNSPARGPGKISRHLSVF